MVNGETETRIEDRIVFVVRELARELGGDRAANAVSATASLERDVGLGSLERVELLMRLETEFGRELDDRFLLARHAARDRARQCRTRRCFERRGCHAATRHHRPPHFVSTT